MVVYYIPRLQSVLTTIPPTCRLVALQGADATLRDDQGRAALHYAVTADRLEMIGHLVARGVDLDVRDDFGATPLHLAVKAGREALAVALLDAKVLGPASGASRLQHSECGPAIKCFGKCVRSVPSSSVQMPWVRDESQSCNVRQ